MWGKTTGVVVAAACLAVAGNLCDRASGQSAQVPGEPAQRSDKPASSARSADNANQRSAGKSGGVEDGANEKPAVSSRDIGPKEDGQTVTCRKGTALAIRLPGNPTTGYSWSITAVSGKSVKQSGQIDYERAKPMLVGSGGAFIAHFLSGNTGSTIIKLGYARPWETGKLPEKTFTVTVNVVK